MGLLKKFFIILLFIFVAFIVGSEPSHAANFSVKATKAGIGTNPPDPNVITENTFLVEITFSDLTPNKKEYRVCPTRSCISHGGDSASAIKKDADGDGIVTITVCGSGRDVKTDCELNRDFFGAETYRIGIYPPGDGESEPLATAEFRVLHAIPDTFVVSPSNPKPGDNLTVKICGNRYPAGNDNRNKIDYDFNPLSGGVDPEDPDDVRIPEGGNHCVTTQLPKGGGGVEGGRYYLNARWDKEDFVLWRATIVVSSTDGTVKTGQGVDSGGGSAEEFAPGYYPEPDNPVEVQTPFGVIQTSPQGIAAAVLSLAIGVAGGVAFLLMVFGAYRLMFAAGNPESIQQGREVITAAVAGLILIIFAVFILRFLGVSIFQIRL